MKIRNKLLAVLLLIALVLTQMTSLAEDASSEPAAAFPAGTPGEVAAVILHTNDVHVGLQDNIGYDGLALYRKELEEIYDHVLLVDAGDAIQGGPIGVISKGAEIIKIMNRIGYDLAIPGNHEFDFGFEVLDDCSEQLDCGYICTNFCTTDGEPVFKPWRMLEAGEIKIAFLAAVTPDTFTKSNIRDILNETGEPMYDFLADETGERLREALQKSTDEARENGADYVILVSHLGNNSSVTPQFKCDAIAGKLHGIDMIIDGHSHEYYNRTVPDSTGKEIPIAQTGTKLKAIGQLTIYRDGRLEERLIDDVPKPESLPAESVLRGKTERYVDPEMKEFLEDIIASYADVMNRKIGTLSYDLRVREEEDGFDFSRVRENALCNLVADAYRTLGKTQAAFINAGSVRNGLSAGDITYQSILGILPYSNGIVTARVTGQTILDALEFGVSKLPEVSGGFPQVSGITYRVNAEIPSSVRTDEKNLFVSVDGARRVSDVRIGGEEIIPEQEYTIAASDFLLDGGDGYTMFSDAKDVTSTMMCDNDMLKKYIEENLNSVIPERYRETEERIQFIAEE